MVKKILQLVLCLIGFSTLLLGIYYFFNKKKKETGLPEDYSEEEPEVFDTTDFFDLSNLKFSRHYVDLR